MRTEDDAAVDAGAPAPARAAGDAASAAATGRHAGAGDAAAGCCGDTACDAAGWCASPALARRAPLEPDADVADTPPPPPPPPAVMPPPVTPIVSATAPSPDPRVGLEAGRWDAGQAAWNMKMISTTPPSPKRRSARRTRTSRSRGKYAIQGNYNGFEIWDISNPAKPVLANAYTCPASQNDVSVYKNLLFMSSEATDSRTDCDFGGVPDPVSKDRVRGIRIFDITDIAHPKLVTSVQTCRGSHTHTVVTQPGDKDNVYIYVSGTSGVRSADELPGCADGGTATIRTLRGSGSK